MERLPPELVSDIIDLVFENFYSISITSKYLNYCSKLTRVYKVVKALEKEEDRTELFLNPELACTRFCRNGDLYSLRILKRITETGIYGRDLFIASDKGHIDIVKYLCKRYSFLTDFDSMNTKSFYIRCMAIAAKSGHLEVVKYMMNSMGIKSSDLDFDYFNVIRQAILNERVEIVEYFREVFGPELIRKAEQVIQILKVPLIVDE